MAVMGRAKVWIKGVWKLLRVDFKHCQTTTKKELTMWGNGSIYYLDLGITIYSAYVYQIFKMYILNICNMSVIPQWSLGEKKIFSKKS